MLTIQSKKESSFAILFRKDAEYCIRKVLNCKFWNDDLNLENECRNEGVKVADVAVSKPWSKSVKDLDFEILVVSQFTLFGSLKKGNKPDFHNSMNSSQSAAFFDRIIEDLKKAYKTDKIQKGQFGSYMQVSLVNDGPVTIVIDTNNSF